MSNTWFDIIHETFHNYYLRGYFKKNTAEYQHLKVVKVFAYCINYVGLREMNPTSLHLGNMHELFNIAVITYRQRATKHNFLLPVVSFMGNVREEID